MANLKIGIVGLPNVGKSTLFNLLTQSSVPAQNYPFCTIDPNVGIVRVKDARLDKLVEMVQPDSVVPAVVEFVDIAGLVKGAHKGEGLGNKFLSHIRETSVIVEVVRAFEDGNVTHVANKVDPIDDIETIELELVLKDIETVKSSIAKQEKVARFDQIEGQWFENLKQLLSHLEDQKIAYTFDWSDDKDFDSRRKALSLLTDKKFIYLINSNKPINSELKEYLQSKYYFEVDLKLVQDLIDLSEEERAEYIKELNVDYKDLNELVKKCYDALGLISFFTAGKQEVRAWTIYRGFTAPQAAGVIHTDFEKNFIAADVVSYDDFVRFGGWEGSKAQGKVRLEGRDYTVDDGDVMIFRHGS